MSRVIGLGIVFAVAVVATPARADQCEVVDSETSAWALKVVKRGMSVAQFCENCGDKTPGAGTLVNTITAAKDGKTGMRVSINNKKVDLAYTYVQTGKATWTNVGLMVGCPAQNVTPVVSVTAEKPAPVSQAPTGLKECDDYMGAVTKLMQCQAFPKEARDAMKQGVDQMRPAIEQAKNAPEARKALTDACKQAHDAIRQAATSMKCQL